MEIAFSSSLNQSAAALLLRVSEALSSTLNLDSIFVSLEELLIPSTCDALSIGIADENGNLIPNRLYNSTVETSNPQNANIDWPYGSALYSKLDSVLHTGTPMILPFIDDSTLAQEAQSAEHFEFLKKLNFRSCIAVPLKSRNRNVGVACFFQGESMRRFSSHDLWFFNEIAFRVGMAVENACLYEKTKTQADDFSALAETIPHQVWVGRAEGATEYVNQRWMDYTGLDRSVGGMDAQQLTLYLIHPDDMKIVEQIVGEAAKKSTEYEMEVRCRRHDNEFLWHNIRGVPVKNQKGEIERWVTTITDINERKVTELALRKAKDEAEKASREKGAFLVNISHEIRTPLTAVIGYSELVKDQGCSSDESKKWLDAVIRNAKSVAQIINDILDISKIETGRMVVEFKNLSVNELLQDVAAVFDIAVQSKHLTLKILPLPAMTLYSDPSRLRQILINLIGNAVKFTNHGGVEVGVRTSNSNPGRVEFRVCDSGIGINREDRNLLFQAFAQADSSLTRKYGGTGLGLVLSKKLAQTLGGDVYLESSEPGKGSCFVCTLNSKIELSGVQETHQLPSISVIAGALRDLHILVVEDSEDNQLLLKRILQGQHANVDSAMNGQQGYEMALARNYDLVLMDVQMPVMNGYEAIKKLRAQGYDRPIIVLTAHALEEEKQKSLASGGTDFLTKPVDKKALFETISKYVRRSAAAHA